MRRRRSVFFAVLIGASTASVGSQAADGKRYAGSFCFFSDGDTQSKDRYPPKFQNTSGATKRVVCPILQDIIDGDIEYASIVASSTIDETTCFLAEREANGSWTTWTRDDTVSAGGGYNITRWFNGASWGDAHSGAAFAIACDIPDDDLVLMYRLDDR